MTRKQTTPREESGLERKGETQDVSRHDDLSKSPPFEQDANSGASVQAADPFVHLTAQDLDLESGLNREWLITNGIGGYGMGALIGARTRHYHGLLVAALEPPSGRVVTVAQLVEAVTLEGGTLEHLHTQDLHTQDLHTQEWGGGAVDPHGYTQLESFTLEGTVPTWRYDLSGAKLEKRVWMKHGHNTTFVTYTLTHGGPVVLEVGTLCTYRDHHGGTKAGEAPRVDALEDGLEVRFPNAQPYFIRSNIGERAGGGEWWYNAFLRVESERGFEALEDAYRAGHLSATLKPGQTLALAFSTEPHAPSTDWALELEAERERVRHLHSDSGLEGEPSWVQQLALAADQFIVSRPLPDGTAGHTVIAGYPWFGDWGRDTMIALPGLTLATHPGRPEVAASLLRTFGKYVDRGMLPNRFPDSTSDSGNEPPEYNTVDATLWYVEAVRAYVAATGDQSLVDDLWATLEDIVRWHLTGTRYGIGVDPGDGLLRAGEPGVQLTWMDARIGDWVVTPRSGKPVEINALWYNALRTLEHFASDSRNGTRKATHDYTALAYRVADSFVARYWNKSSGYLYDVIDGPGGDDPTIRPNAVIAASLEHSPVESATRRMIVERARKTLLTPYGLRSLEPGEPHYTGQYLGSPLARDGVYHQGTVWPWLIGPFVAAHLHAFGDPAEARAFLEPVAQHLLEGGLGSVSEILDGDAPFTPRGCPWQAWSVAEVLRAWQLTALGTKKVKR